MVVATFEGLAFPNLFVGEDPFRRSLRSLPPFLGLSPCDQRGIPPWSPRPTCSCEQIGLPSREPRWMGEDQVIKKAVAAQVSCIEGTLRFPQRGKLARLEATLPFSLWSRDHARSASSHGLLPQLTFAV
jgi:hypothetical protein